MRRPSGESEIPDFTTWNDRRGSGLPSNSISPEWYGTCPMTALISVDLPAPLAPMTETISPAGMDSDTLSSARIAP